MYFLPHTSLQCFRDLFRLLHSSHWFWGDLQSLVSLEYKPRLVSAVQAAQHNTEQQDGIRKDKITPALRGTLKRMVWMEQSTSFVAVPSSEAFRLDRTKSLKPLDGTQSYLKQHVIDCMWPDSSWNCFRQDFDPSWSSGTLATSKCI